MNLEEWGTQKKHAETADILTEMISELEDGMDVYGEERIPALRHAEQVLMELSREYRKARTQHAPWEPGDWPGE